MQKQVELLREIFMPASLVTRLPLAVKESSVASCMPGCSGKCASVQSEDKLPDNFYA